MYEIALTLFIIIAATTVFSLCAWVLYRLLWWIAGRKIRKHPLAMCIQPIEWRNDSMKLYIADIREK